MNKTKLIYVFIYIFLFASCAQDTAVPELKKPAGIIYDTVVAIRGDIFLSSQLNAYVESHSEGLYFTRGDLPVDWVVELGEPVKQGDILASLNTKSNEEQIKIIEAIIADLKIRNDFADRIKELYIKEAALELAESKQLNAGEAEIAQKEYMLEKLNLELRQQSEIQNHELNRQIVLLSQLAGQLENITITAPFDGRIVMVNISEGDIPAAYRPVIYIADDRLGVVYTGVDSTRSTVPLKCTGRIFNREYKLERIIPTTEELRSYFFLGKPVPSRFIFLEPDDFIKAGQHVEITILHWIVEDVVILPVNAVYQGDIGTYAYIFENGQRVRRPVEAGLSNASFIEIKSGIEEGDEVFVKP